MSVDDRKPVDTWTDPPTSEKRLRPPILQGGTLGQEPFSSRVLSCALMFKKEGRLNAQSNLTLQGTFCCVNLQCSDTYK